MRHDTLAKVPDKRSANCAVHATSIAWLASYDILNGFQKEDRIRDERKNTYCPETTGFARG